VLLRLKPQTLLLAVATFVTAAWMIFIAVDILDVAGTRARVARPMWTYLFNDHFVEVTQWVVMAVTVLAMGYVAGRLRWMGHRGASTFFFLLGIGLGLMLVEEAGDVRHTISGEVQRSFGTEIFGLPYQFVSDAPYFAALAAVPLYAFIRYGRYAWRAPSARSYVVAAVVLYAVAAIGSALRHIGGLYISVGAAVDRYFFDGRFPPAPNMTQERAHYFVVDGPIEESIELFAATCMLAIVLAFGADVRSGKLSGQGAAQRSDAESEITRSPNG
jgi:hypothetical protein